MRVDITSNGFKRNPFPTLARAHAAGPLVHTRVPFIGRVSLATTYDAVREVLKASDRFVVDGRNAGRGRFGSMGLWMPPSFRLLADNMLGRDEPDHRRLRALVDHAFQRQSIEALRSRIVALADAALDEVEARARTTNAPVDLLHAFARPLPLAVISEMLGLPADDKAKFMTWAAGLLRVSSPLGLFAALGSVRRMTAYLRRRIQRTRKHPQPGLIAALVEAEEAGERLSENELLSMVFLLLIAGHETTVHLITGSVWTLLEHPRERAELGADWSEVAIAVEELLRHVSAVQMTKPRYAAADTEVAGVALRRGQVVVPFLAAANADPAVFPDPARLDLRRDPNPHVAFGSGIHVCLGMRLARVETAVAMERLFTRFPGLSLGVNGQQLRWTKRLGIRALTALPVRLRG